VARNVGFQISDGDIITYLDSDDVLAENRVKNLRETFEKYQVDLLFNNYIIVDINGIEQEVDHFNYIRGQAGARQYIKLLERQNISVPMGVAHTRGAFVSAGGFQRGIVCGEDGILWRRIRELVGDRRIMFSDDTAGSYFINPEGQSRTQKRYEMGGFAFDNAAPGGANGQYLDTNWYLSFNSVDLFDKKES
jgi:glycosyltransferase involved in cell wall biosynthesis